MSQLLQLKQLLLGITLGAIVFGAALGTGYSIARIQTLESDLFESKRISGGLLQEIAQLNYQASLRENESGILKKQINSLEFRLTEQNRLLQDSNQLRMENDILRTRNLEKENQIENLTRQISVLRESKIPVRELEPRNMTGEIIVHLRGKAIGPQNSSVVVLNQDLILSYPKLRKAIQRANQFYLDCGRVLPSSNSQEGNLEPFFTPSFCNPPSAGSERLIFSEFVYYRDLLPATLERADEDIRPRQNTIPMTAITVRNTRDIVYNNTRYTVSLTVGWEMKDVQFRVRTVGSAEAEVPSSRIRNELFAEFPRFAEVIQSAGSSDRPFQKMMKGEFMSFRLFAFGGELPANAIGAQAIDVEKREYRRLYTIWFAYNNVRYYMEIDSTWALVYRPEGPLANPLDPP